MLKLRTPENIQAIPGHVAKVDPKVTPLSHILQYYYIRPFEIHCALCGKAHMEGCIVQLVNGHITNIGHICGARFGDKFSLEKQKFSESQRKPDLIRKMTDASTKLSKLHFELENYRHQCGALARRQENFGRMFPELRQVLTRRALNNQAVVFKSIELSEEQIDEEKAAQPHKSREDLRYKEELVGTVRGYRLPTFDWSISEGLRKFFREANQFSELNPRAMSMQDLTKWTNWCEDMDEAIAQIVSAIKEGEEFFIQENFQLFQYLPATPDTVKKLKVLTLSALDGPTIMEAPQRVEPSPKSQKRAPGQHRQTLSPKEWRRLTGNKKAW
jgi:hypothetical protein